MPKAEDDTALKNKQYNKSIRKKRHCVSLTCPQVCCHSWPTSTDDNWKEETLFKVKIDKQHQRIFPRIADNRFQLIVEELRSYAFYGSWNNGVNNNNDTTPTAFIINSNNENNHNNNNNKPMKMSPITRASNRKVIASIPCYYDNIERNSLYKTLLLILPKKVWRNFQFLLSYLFTDLYPQLVNVRRRLWYLQKRGHQKTLARRMNKIVEPALQFLGTNTSNFVFILESHDRSQTCLICVSETPLCANLISGQSPLWSRFLSLFLFSVWNSFCYKVF